MSPIWAQDGPRDPQGSQNGPSKSQECPKMLSWGPRIGPGTSQETPKAPQRSSPERPRDPQETPLDSKSQKSLDFWSLIARSGVQSGSLKHRKIDEKCLKYWNAF